MSELIIDEKIIDDLTVLRNALLDESGREINNPKPLYLDVTPRKISVKDEMLRIIRNELSQNAQDQGFESFEEADDFNVYDDFETPESSTEYEIMQEEYEVPAMDPTTLGNDDSGTADETTESAGEDASSQNEPED